MGVAVVLGPHLAMTPLDHPRPASSPPDSSPPADVAPRGSSSDAAAETPRGGGEMARSRRSSGRRALARTGLVLASTLVCLVLLELTVRAIEPREMMRYFFSRPDPVLHHRFIPSATGYQKTIEYNAEYRINSLGLRDREYALHKPIGTFRILMVGDSFTEGVGVAPGETFSKLVEARLQRRPGQMKFEVINAGVASYSPLLEYLYLKNQGLELGPDLVVLNFDLSDVYDDITYTALARLDAQGLPVAVSPSPEEEQGMFLTGPAAVVKDWVKAHVRLYNFIRARIEPLLDRLADPEDASGDIYRDKYAMLRETYVDGERNWALTHRYLLLIRDMLAEHDIDFWITVYPYGLQVHPKEWSSGRQFWHFRPDTVYPTWPQDALARWSDAHGIKAINMCPDFQELSKTTFPLYWAYDGHWVPRGHQLVADVILRNLEPYLAAKAGPESESETTAIGAIPPPRGQFVTTHHPARPPSAISSDGARGLGAHTPRTEIASPDRLGGDRAGTERPVHREARS
jgi:hypothetical protein